MIRLSLFCFVYWCGVVRKPESASRFDEFAIHSRVGVFQRSFSGSDPDFLLIVEHDIRVSLDQRCKFPSNGDLPSDECLRNLMGDCSSIFWRRVRMVTASHQSNDDDREESSCEKTLREMTSHRLFSTASS